MKSHMRSRLVLHMTTDGRSSPSVSAQHPAGRTTQQKCGQLRHPTSVSARHAGGDVPSLDEFFRFHARNARAVALTEDSQYVFVDAIESRKNTTARRALRSFIRLR